MGVNKLMKIKCEPFSIDLIYVIPILLGAAVYIRIALFWKYFYFNAG